METGSRFIYLGNEKEDYEAINVSEVNDVVLSDSDCSDDDGETCVLDILDTAGQEEFSSLRDQYFRTGDGFVVIYSIIDRQSFEEAESILRRLKRIRSDNFQAILVANKQDLAGVVEIKVTIQEGKDLAQKVGILFYETSAKTGSGVQLAMQGLVKIIPRVSSAYKVVVLGAGAVGKSNITLRFVSDSFMEDYDPTIEDSFRKMVRVPGLKAISKDRKKILKKEKREKLTQGFKDDRVMKKAIRKDRTKILKGERKKFAPGNEDDRIRKITQRKADGNVLLIPLRNLTNNPNVLTMKLVKCKKCEAILTSTGKLESEAHTFLTMVAMIMMAAITMILLNKMVMVMVWILYITVLYCLVFLKNLQTVYETWTCEFCGNLNENLEPSKIQIPKENEFDCMISPPTHSKETRMENSTPKHLQAATQNDMVAIGTTVLVYLHPNFVFNEPAVANMNNSNRLKIEVDSLEKETDLTFMFTVKDGTKSRRIKFVPFQVQIQYTRSDGAQCLRVFSKTIRAINSRQVMEDNINVPVLGVSAMQTTAKMVQAGQPKEAQHLMKSFKRLVDRGAKGRRQGEERVAFKQETAQWDDYLTQNHRKMGHGHLDDDDIKMLTSAKQAITSKFVFADDKMPIIAKRKVKPTSKAAP